MTTDRPVFSVCSGVLAASLLLVLSPSAYADDMGGLWPVKDSAVVSAHEAGLDGSGVKIGVLDTRVVSDYPGLSDANIEYRLGSFVNTTTDKPDECLIKDVPLQKTVTSKEGGCLFVAWHLHAYMAGGQWQELGCQPRGDGFGAEVRCSVSHGRARWCGRVNHYL